MQYNEEPDQSSSFVQLHDTITTPKRLARASCIINDKNMSFPDQILEESARERLDLGKRNAQMKNYLAKYPNICVSPKEGYVS